MKDEKPFKVVQEYIKLTQEDIAEFLDVSVRTVSSWSTDKFTNKKIKSNPPEKEEKDRVDKIVEKGFLSEARMAGFIARLKHLGYDVSDYDNENLTRDNFTELLREYLAEALNKADSDIYIKKKPSKDITILKFKKPENYFTQILYMSDENNPDYTDVIFEVSKCNFSKINKKKRLLIEAVGGQGKTTFLKHLEQKASQSDEYSSVFYVDLPELVSLKKEDLYQFSDTDTPHIFTYLSSIAEDISDVASCFADDETKPVLLLLDGFNEIFALSDFEKTHKIVSELDFISNEWSNTTIIMTTRPSTEKRNFLNNYHTCHISGTPADKVEELLNKNDSISEEIKQLSSIPMFYKAITKAGNKKINTKYELLSDMYFDKYRQSAESIEAFLAFYIFAPFLAKEMINNNKNRVSYSEITTFAEKFKKMHLDEFIRNAQKEYDISYPVCGIDIKKVCSVFLNKGPVELSTTTGEDNYRFHDEIQDFLLAFLAVISIKVCRESLSNEYGYKHIQDLEFRLNLKDNAALLIKEKLNIFSGDDIYKLKEQFKILDDCKLTGQAIWYGYCLFMLSDNLGLGISAVEPAHNILINFTNRIKCVIKQNNFESCFKELSSEEQRKCENAMLDVITKHCEYYRRCGDYTEGIKLITEVAEKINPDYDAIRHSKSKLLLLMYESHIKGTIYDLQSIGLADHSEIYTEGIQILEKSAKNNFNLSSILLASLHSTPAPYLHNAELTKIDYIKAFHLYRSLILANRYPRYVAKRTAYAVRQIVGLLLKGYVKFNTADFEVYEEGDPGNNNTIVLGDKNTLSLDENTIKLAKYFLSYADGITVNTLNYFRGIIAYYDEDFAVAKYFFNNESDKLLKTIFQYYAFGETTDLDSMYEELKAKMNDSDNNVIDRCHPVYWYCDAKLLELSFNEDKNRKGFFDNFEKDLPESLKRIINQITE